MVTFICITEKHIKRKKCVLYFLSLVPIVGEKQGKMSAISKYVNRQHFPRRPFGNIYEKVFELYIMLASQLYLKKAGKMCYV